MTKVSKKSTLSEPLTRGIAVEILTALTKGLATKEDLSPLATKDDTKGMATKTDLKATETRLKHHVGEEIGAISSDVLTSIDEVISPMQQFNRIEKSQERLIQALNGHY